ncbi:MAG: TetR/AcrR family transcriptional regulator [Parahaliea sp.]
MSKRNDRTRAKQSGKYLEVLEVAARTFQRKGYHHASISDIADELGILKGSLYYYIASKEELLEDIVLAALRAYSDSLEHALKLQEPAEKVLEKAVVAFLSPGNVSYAMRVVFISERKHLGPTASRHVEKEIIHYEKLWLNVIHNGVREKVFRDDIDPSILLRTFFGMANWSSEWFDPDGKYNLEQLGDFFASIFIDGIRRR